MIGDEVTVTVLGVKGNQVRIGVNAPKDVSVHREEVFDRIRAELQKEAVDLAQQEGAVEVEAATQQEDIVTESQQDSIEAVSQPATTEEVTKAEVE